MADIILSKQSTSDEIKAYFNLVVHIIETSREEFPINLDSVWALVYGRKEEAVRALISDPQFMESVDYQVLRKNAENPLGGRPSNEYYLSVPCLEYFIARKVHAVFEVYRQVFHAARKGQLQPKPMTHIQMLAAQAQAMAELEQRQMEQERKQALIEHKIESIETRIRDNGFMSVMGFANIHHLNIGKKAAQAIGRLASKWCKRNGRIPEKTKHERWGEVNTYPMEALKCCFAEFYPDRRGEFAKQLSYSER